MGCFFVGVVVVISGRGPFRGHTVAICAHLSQLQELLIVLVLVFFAVVSAAIAAVHGSRQSHSGRQVVSTVVVFRSVFVDVPITVQTTRRGLCLSEFCCIYFHSSSSPTAIPLRFVFHWLILL